MPCLFVNKSLSIENAKILQIREKGKVFISAGCHVCKYIISNIRKREKSSPSTKRKGKCSSLQDAMYTDIYYQQDKNQEYLHAMPCLQIYYQQNKKPKTSPLKLERESVHLCRMPCLQIYHQQYKKEKKHRHKKEKGKVFVSAGCHVCGYCRNFRMRNFAATCTLA